MQAFKNELSVRTGCEAFEAEHSVDLQDVTTVPSSTALTIHFTSLLTLQIVKLLHILSVYSLVPAEPGVQAPLSGNRCCRAHSFSEKGVTEQWSIFEQGALFLWRDGGG